MICKFLLLWSLLFASLIQAAERPKQLKYASREQLRACDETEARLRLMRRETDTLIAQYNAQQAQVQTSRLALEAEQSKMNHLEALQVRAFEEKTSAHNQLVQSFNLLAQQAQAQSDAYNQETDIYNQGCATMVFRIEDRNALMQEKLKLKN